MTRDSEERRNGEDPQGAECEARPNGAEGNRPDSIAHKQLIERLTAIDEEAMYQAPATTYATVNEAAQAILSLIKRAEAAEAQRDELRGALDCHETVEKVARRLASIDDNGPDHNWQKWIEEAEGAVAVCVEQALHNTTNHGESNG